MTDRDRLIELISKVQYMGGLESKLADHLLANGVIVPPFKLDTKVWCIIKGFSRPMQATIREISLSKVGFQFLGSVVGYYGQTFREKDFGKTVFLTKEEAEEKLKELNNNA